MILVKMQGGLGNQMFEYAMGRAFQEKYQEPLILEYRTPYSKDSVLRQLDVLENFNIKYDSVITNCRDYWSVTGLRGEIFKWVLLILKIIRKIGGDEARYKVEVKFMKFLNKQGFFICSDRFLDFMHSDKKIKLLFGYWQSEKYFNFISTQIRKELSLKKSSLTHEGLQLSENIRNVNSVCVHVRRGDYLKIPLHFLCKERYYIEAMKLMENKVFNPVFFIFSDDIEWTKEHIKSASKTVYVDNISTDYEELAIMSYCKHFIIANSSFSWWAQYLSTHVDKIVIAPSRWYNGKVSDIYMEDWHLLKV